MSFWKAHLEFATALFRARGSLAAGSINDVATVAFTVTVEMTRHRLCSGDKVGRKSRVPHCRGSRDTDPL